MRVLKPELRPPFVVDCHRVEVHVPEFCVEPQSFRGFTAHCGQCSLRCEPWFSDVHVGVGVCGCQFQGVFWLWRHGPPAPDLRRTPLPIFRSFSLGVVNPGGFGTSQVSHNSPRNPNVRTSASNFAKIPRKDPQREDGKTSEFWAPHPSGSHL